MSESWDALEADFERFYGRDLRLDAERVGMRRLWVLVKGLPSEAAVWRGRMLPFADEMAAVLVERNELWSRAVLEGVTHQKRISVPPGITIMRPGESTGTQGSDDEAPEMTPRHKVREFFARKL